MKAAVECMGQSNAISNLCHSIAVSENAFLVARKGRLMQSTGFVSVERDCDRKVVIFTAKECVKD